VSCGWVVGRLFTLMLLLFIIYYYLPFNLGMGCLAGVVSSAPSELAWLGVASTSTGFWFWSVSLTLPSPWSLWRVERLTFYITIVLVLTSSVNQKSVIYMKANTILFMARNVI
jgi:hypothetical protein